jgi:hypothetical protein
MSSSSFSSSKDSFAKRKRASDRSRALITEEKIRHPLVKRASAPNPEAFGKDNGFDDIDLECCEDSIMGDAANKRQKTPLISKATGGIADVSEILSTDDEGMVDSMLVREQICHPNPKCLKSQKEMDHMMRAILIDWMFEVGQEFALCRETVHLAINYVDRYVSKNFDTPRFKLQLLGVTALFISSKLEEMNPGKASDFAFTTDGAYTATQIHDMERQVLESLEWRLLGQTPFLWLKMHIKLICCRVQDFVASDLYQSSEFCGLSADSVWNTLLSADNFCRCCELLDMAVHFVQSLSFYPSTLTLAALSVVSPALKSLFSSYSHYGSEAFNECVEFVNRLSCLSHRPLHVPQRCFWPHMKSPAHELYTRQLHHPEGLQLYKELSAQNCLK